MSDPKDGGPAFPRPMSQDGDGSRAEAFVAQDGMSLRDWFAGQALAGFSANHRWLADSWVDTAEAAYRQADAMIRARGETT